MTISFSIDCYVGPLPLQFGMTPPEVEAIIGAARLLPDPFGRRSELREGISLGYCEGRLCEAVFSQGVVLTFRGQDLFQHPDPVQFLAEFDPPYEGVGMIFFLGLGIRLSGFHDQDESQKAIGIVSKGLWDEFVGDLVPYPVGDRTRG